MGLAVSDLGGKSDKKKTPFCQRLEYVVVSLGGGPTKLVKTLDNQIPLSTLNRYLEGETDVPSYRIGLIADATRVSLDWLILGKGHPEIGNNAPTRNPNSGNPDIVMIPLLNVAAAAGAGAVNHDVHVLDQIPYSYTALRRLGVNPDKVEAIRATGDSMEPTIRDGALVLVDRAKREVREDAVYAISIGDDVRVKRIKRRFDGSLALISDNNTLYPEEILSRADAEQLKVHGRVFWTERLL